MAILVAINAHAYQRRSNDQLTLFYGTAFHFNTVQNGAFSHRIAVDYLSKYSCVLRPIYGFGVQADFLNRGRYTVGAKVTRTFTNRLPNRWVQLYFGVLPSFSSNNAQVALNAKPLTGVRFNTWSDRLIGFTMEVEYGYDIPILAPANFAFGRHDLSAKLGVTINLGGSRRKWRQELEEG